MSATILIVDDEKHTREGLEQALEDDYDVYLAANAEEAFNLFEVDKFDVVLTDLKMAGKSGMSVIDKALTLSYRPIVIMMTAYGSVDTAVEAMKRGAHDFLTKPVNLEKLEILIKRALQNRELKQENTTLHERLDQKYSFTGIIGNSPAITRVLEQVKLVAPARATVLLEGETGTGKEVVAQAIHQNSDRSRRPFIAVHCEALSANLLEDELFGHEKGAFTGAVAKRVGRFEAADSGTLFLDEIGEIDASTQVKLLRFLETRSFERLGSTKSIQVDVRLVAATNRNLEQMVQKGQFREDLFYRLNVVRIMLPPLRERKDDIPLLMNHFLKQFASENNLPQPELTAGAINALRKYRWPGNIRELRNFCENTIVMSRGQRITEYDLDPRFTHAGGLPQPSAQDENYPPSASPLSVEENEKRLLRDALKKSKGVRTEAAKMLGISRRTLHRKIEKWPELDVR